MFLLLFLMICVHCCKARLLSPYGIINEESLKIKSVCQNMCGIRGKILKIKQKVGWFKIFFFRKDADLFIKTELLHLLLISLYIISSY